MPNIFGLGPQIADIFGISGMLCVVGAYAYNNIAAQVNALLFNGVNLLGAILLAISLTVHFNLASMILEGVWAAIAVYGIGKSLRSKGEADGA